MRCQTTARLLAFSLGVLTLVAASLSSGQTDDPAYVKASYLRFIAEFTTWPAGAFTSDDGPIVIGTMGDDRSGVIAAMREGIELKGLSAQHRRIVVRPLTLDPSVRVDEGERFVSRVAECHLLFLGESERANWPRIRTLIEGRAVVTVSEIGGFSRGHGMIEFVIKDDRVALHIDHDAVTDAGLRLSSRLLGLEIITIVRGAREATLPQVDRSAAG